MGGSDKDIQGGHHSGQNNYHIITCMVTFKKIVFIFTSLNLKTFIALLTWEYLVLMKSYTRNNEEFFCFYVTFYYDFLITAVSTKTEAGIERCSGK